ncbi:hypothetical protein CTEN210_07273 [Chaetoceros tenuissimus]|uniref:3'-5' exonuclease domain-containing protein n=4 Tax=Chaetoceros tenuissimus TaxID=426638 RepID=A0AAD3CRM0_9STRA|nr:hypothetical protein CTEN210_00008 [Chaetoceros tenuissimus]GFH46268.1 hypothetical protein CTEN210_02742 [Chaetoceros tenuissimus]GFH50797.1 hypothetical protein CTEN210_07273 [Chaetoceros tenuissimus]
MAKSKRKYVSKTLNSNKGKTTSAAKAAKTYKKATETRVLARGLANFVQHGTIRNIIESPRVMIERMWNEFRRRDANYEVRRPTHTNNDDYYDVKESTRTEDELNQDDGDDDGDGSSFEEDSSYFDDIKISVMHKYAKSIVERLAVECNTADPIKSEEKWLLSYLKMHNFWIRKDTAEYICQNLGIEFNLVGYYRDILMWLPDEQYGIDPICPTCKSNKRIGVHGYLDLEKTPCRKVIDIADWYCIAGRRYKCHECMQEKREPYTFMSYDKDSVKQLPRRLSFSFPAFLTKGCAFDMKIVDLMRPIRDANVSFTRFRDIIEEMHAVEHCKRAILHEHSRDDRADLSERHLRKFSHFRDKTEYDGYVPGRRVFRSTYLEMHNEIRSHLDAETKKHGIKVGYADATYRAMKRLGCFNGQKLVDCLVTIKNEYGVARAQFASPSDAKDNYARPLENMVDTFNQYGFSGPSWIYVDNPLQSGWLIELFPSLGKKQKEYDKLYETEQGKANDYNNDNSECVESIIQNEDDEFFDADMDNVADDNADDDGFYDANDGEDDCDFNFDHWFQESCHYSNTIGDINQRAEKVIGHLGLNSDNTDPIVIGLDGEWFVPTNREGKPCGKPWKISLIQIAYLYDHRNENRIEYKNVRCELFHLNHSWKVLPEKLNELLMNKRIQFAGCQVSGDISKINKDFRSNIECSERTIRNLAPMAQARGIQLCGKGLDSLAPVVLQKECTKELQLSDWKWRQDKILSIELQKYAARDALYSKMCDVELEKYEDLTIPLKPEMIVPDMVVDLAPYYTSNLSVRDQASVGAIAKIVPNQESWVVPSILHTSSNVARGLEPGRFLIELTDIKAPALKVKDMLVKGTNRFVTLGEIGVGKHVMVPIEMIRKHNPNRNAIALNTKDQSRIAKRKVTKKAGSRHVTKRRRNRKNTTADIFDVDRAMDRNDQVVEEGDPLHTFEESDFDWDSLRLEDIDTIEKCLELAKDHKMALPGRDSANCQNESYLDVPPDKIFDRFSSLLGSPFHAIHRFKLMMKHSHRKAFYVALSEAFFQWSEQDLAVLEAKLAEKKGMDRKAIYLCRYFKRKYFSKRCRRICLPPSRLYWRIRNVFEIFGSKCDVDTGKPLFSDGDWVKANTILKEVLHGYYSDPPGLNLYQFELTNKGEIKYDLLLQVPLLRCKRDTNALEGSHSHINNAFGPSACGPEIADAILAEHRHRSNLRACQKNLSNFPKIGHYNTWMIDAHVKVYERNHNELLYPTWICASDFAPTEEKFGFVSLVGKELEKEINDTVKVRDDKMTPTAKYLSKACGMVVHPRPWSTEYECKCLYQKLFTEATKIHKNMDKVDELMTRLILKHVDGVKVFPKTKAYNRIYRKRRKHYETLQKASRLMARDETLLHSVNILTAHQKQGYEKPTAEASSDVDMNTEDVNAEESTLDKFVTDNFGTIQKQDAPKERQTMKRVNHLNFVHPAFPQFAGLYQVNMIQAANHISYQAPRHERNLVLPVRGPDKICVRQERKCKNCKKGKSDGCRGGSTRRPRNQPQRYCDTHQCYF